MIYLFSAIFFMLLQGFFCASEISFISSRLIKLRHRQAKGDKRAAKIYHLMLEPEKFLATTLVGVNVSLVLSSSSLTFFLIKLGVKNSNLWTTVFFTPLVVIFSELIPKNTGRLFKEDFNCRLGALIDFFETLFSPVVKSIDFVNKFFVKTFIGKVRKRSLFVTKEEIKSIVKEIEREGGIDKGEKEAIEEVFDFRVDKLGEACVALAKVVTLDYAAAYEQISSVIRTSGFTRYPVARNKKIAGYINIYDLFYNPGRRWQSFIRPLSKLGAGQNLYDAFRKLKAKKETIALVQEGNRIRGIVTLHDLIYEILTSMCRYK